MRRLLFIPVALMAFAAVAEKQPFERYQSILDRQMFGQPPKGFDPTKMPSEVSKSSMSDKELTAEQEVIQKAIHFSVINVTPSGEVEVGFSDNSDPKVPVHYYLKVGEKENKWTVKEADAEKATMTIANDDGVEVTLRLGDNSATAGGGGNSGGSGRRGGIGGSMSGPVRSGGLLGGAQSLRARRRQREEADAAAREKERAAAEEKAAAEKADREAREAADKAEREAERAEQRKELMAIQEQLRRVREEKAAAKESAASDDSGNDEN